METRIALIGIIVEDLKASDALNKTLHDFAPISLEEWVYHILKRK